MKFLFVAKKVVHESPIPLACVEKDHIIVTIALLQGLLTKTNGIGYQIIY